MTATLASILKEIRIEDFDFQTYRDDKEKTWDIDPLILSVSLKDLSDKTGRIFSLENSEVRNNVTPEIVARAETIRKYYTKKFFWKNLSGTGNLSPFRQRLCYLLENRSLITKDRDAGIYFKVPWFYDEDMIYDDFKNTLITKDLPRLDHKVQPIAKRLTFISKSFGWQHKRKARHFWFKDDDKYLHGITILDDNPLLETFESLIQSLESCVFITRISEDRIDDMYYYKLHKFKLIKE